MLSFARVVHWKEIQKTADWGVLLLFGGGLCLSNVLKQTGTSVFLANALSDMVSHMGIFVVILVVATFVVFLTEFASNTASAALLIPVFVHRGRSVWHVASALVGIDCGCGLLRLYAPSGNPAECYCICLRPYQAERDDARWALSQYCVYWTAHRDCDAVLAVSHCL